MVEGNLWIESTLSFNVILWFSRDNLKTIATTMSQLHSRQLLVVASFSTDSIHVNCQTIPFVYHPPTLKTGKVSKISKVVYY